MNPSSSSSSSLFFCALDLPYPIFLPAIAVPTCTSTNTSITVIWPTSVSASGYYLALITSLEGVVVFQESLTPSTSNYSIPGLQSFTAYNVTLTTEALSGTNNGSSTITIVTQVSPVSSASFLSTTATSVTFQFLPSTGATSYSFTVQNQM